MSDSKPQNYANHTKLVPAFHFFVSPVLFLNLIWSLCWFLPLSNRSSGVAALISHFLNVLVAIALIVLAILARLFALGVQDRVIRLEEQLRFQKLLSDDLKPRIGEFTVTQLVALRFASDAELPALARKVLDSQLNDRKAIKQMVQNWRADYQRV